MAQILSLSAPGLPLILRLPCSIAYDVSLNDDVWPAENFDVVGNATKTWEKLEG